MLSDKPVPREVIDNIVRVAGTSPSGAHTEVSGLPSQLPCISGVRVKRTRTLRVVVLDSDLTDQRDFLAKMPANSADLL